MTRAGTRSVLCGLLALAPAVAVAQPVPLTLADATSRALERLPEVAIQRDAIVIAAEGETRAAAAYDSVLRLDSRVRSRTDPNNFIFVGAPEGALAPRINSVQASVAWSRLFESGATVTGSASTSLERTNGLFFLLSPAYFTQAGVEVRQPLLSGRRLNPQRRALKVSALDVSRSRAAFEHLVAETVAAVERAYWALQATKEDVRIRERSLALAEAQRDDTKVRIDAGVAAEAELAAPQAEIARRRADLVRAHDDAGRADIALRQLVAGTADSPAWSMAFELTDEPPPAIGTESVDALVRDALTRRPELTDIDAARQIAELDTALARERDRTQLDLVAAYNLRGLAGTENPDLFVPYPGGSVNVPPGLLGGYDDSLQNLAAHRFADVYVGISMALPIGRRAAKADVVVATLAERRTALLREQVAQRIAAEVRTAAAVLDGARERLDAATALESASTDLLAAEQARFETGQSGNFFVLTRQTELAQAALTLTAARIEVARASTELLRATGRLLERRGITLDTPPAPPAKAPNSAYAAPTAANASPSRASAFATASDRTIGQGAWPAAPKGTAR